MSFAVKTLLLRVNIANYNMRDVFNDIYRQALFQEMSLDRHVEVFDAYMAVMKHFLNATRLSAQADVLAVYEKNVNITSPYIKAADASYQTCQEINAFAKLVGSSDFIECRRITFSDL